MYNFLTIFFDTRTKLIQGVYYNQDLLNTTLLHLKERNKKKQKKTLIHT